MRACTVSVRRGTPSDLIDAAGLGARITARSYRAQGQDGKAIRRTVIARYRQILDCAHHDVYEGETLMAAVQRAVAAVLAEPAARPAPEYVPWSDVERGFA